MFLDADVRLGAGASLVWDALRDVGVRFRGASSFFTVPAGHKRSLNLSIDYVHGKQRLRGKKTLVTGVLNKISCFFTGMMPRGLTSRASMIVMGKPKGGALPASTSPPKLPASGEQP